MEVEATAAILVDTTYGSLDVLYDQNSHERRYPASITKVMTALLTVEAVDNGQLSLDDWITVGPEVNHEVGSGSSTQNIQEGEVMRLEDVLYCAPVSYTHLDVYKRQGWRTQVLASATWVAMEASSSPAMNREAASRPPFTPKETTPQVPSGMYFFARA